MKRFTEITTDLGTEEDPLTMTVANDGITIETEPARTVGSTRYPATYVRLTPEQFELCIQEYARFIAATAMLAHEPPPADVLAKLMAAA